MGFVIGATTAHTETKNEKKQKKYETKKLV